MAQEEEDCPWVFIDRLSLGESVEFEPNSPNDFLCNQLSYIKDFEPQDWRLTQQEFAWYNGDRHWPEAKRRAQQIQIIDNYIGQLIRYSMTKKQSTTSKPAGKPALDDENKEKVIDWCHYYHGKGTPPTRDYGFRR